MDLAFAQRLLATTANGTGKKMLDAACKGRLIGLHVAAEGCLTELANRARGWNSSIPQARGGGAAVLASASILECAHLCQVRYLQLNEPPTLTQLNPNPNPNLRQTFFENSDSGQAH